MLDHNFLAPLIHLEPRLPIQADSSRSEAFTVNDKQLLLDYLDFVFTRTKDDLSTVKNTYLKRVLNEPQYQPLPTLSIRLASVINCNTRHVDQIEYLRGLIKHLAWFPTVGK